MQVYGFSYLLTCFIHWCAYIRIYIYMFIYLLIYIFVFMKYLLISIFINLLIYIFTNLLKTRVALGVLAALLEDSIAWAGPKSVRGNWPPGASR